MDFVREKKPQNFATNILLYTPEYNKSSLVLKRRVKKQKKNNSQTVMFFVFFTCVIKTLVPVHCFYKGTRKYGQLSTIFEIKTMATRTFFSAPLQSLKDFQSSAKFFTSTLEKVSPSRWNHSHISP